MGSYVWLFCIGVNEAVSKIEKSWPRHALDQEFGMFERLVQSKVIIQ